MSDALEQLLRLLDLERIDRDIFRGITRSEGQGRVFGGQVAAQALAAAGRTVAAEHRVNSLHAYFLRPGRFGIPIIYTVDRIRDGGSFTTRRVVALQDGEAILNLDASFHRDEPGADYQLASAVDRAEPPDAGTESRFGDPRSPNRMPFDTREVDVRGADGARDDTTARAMWVRTAGSLPDDQLVHACVVTFLSDMGPVGAVRRRAGGWGPGGAMSASLDHCLWFHRPVRADDWLLYRLETMAAAGARGTARGEIWTQAGTLCVTVVQEVLIRPPRAPEERA